MEMKIRQEHICVPGLKNTYRFLHVTDNHIACYDERETPERAEYGAGRVEQFTVFGVSAAERFAELWSFAAQHSDPESPDCLDGVLLTGDIVDFPSEANQSFLEKNLAALDIPWVYTLGNHDWAYFDEIQTPHCKAVYRPRFARFCDGNIFVHKRRIGELTVVAVDNSGSCYEDGVAEELEGALSGEKHVLLIQHVPLYSPTLHDDTAAVWKTDICVGGEAVCINDNWRAVERIILAKDSPVRAVIAGHLHFWHKDLIGGVLPQYVTAAAYEGATVFTVSG